MKKNPEKGSKGGLALRNIKSDYKASLIKTLWYWQMNRVEENSKSINRPKYIWELLYGT